MRIPKSVTSLNIYVYDINYLNPQNEIKYVKKLKISGNSYPDELFSIVRPLDSFSCDESNLLYLIKQLKDYNFSINIKIKLRF